MVVEANVHEFEAERGKMLGDLQNIKAVGEYVLELYFDPAGARPSAVIEVNKKDESGDYNKYESVWFYDDKYEDPESVAKESFGKMKQSPSSIESFIAEHDDLSL